MNTRKMIAVSRDFCASKIATLETKPKILSEIVQTKKDVDCDTDGINQTNRCGELLI